MARIRTVFPTDEIAHLWAHQSAPHARNPSHNFWFNGPVIYSYGGHFPIARHVRKDDGSHMVLFTTADYSVTTSRHKDRVRRAIPSYVRVVNVPHVTEESYAPKAADNLRAIVGDVTEYLGKAYRARSNRDYYLSHAASRADDAKFLAAWYGLPEPQFPSLDVVGAKAIAQAQREVREEEKRQREAQRAARFEECRKEIAAWIAGASDIYTRTGWRDILGTDHMRIAPDNPAEVETSQGARVPLAHVVSAWRRIASVYASSAAINFRALGHSPRLGYYTLDMIDADGTLHVGCHRFARAEVERFARVLGLIEEQAQQAA